jgi:restriction endonuclease S subunit
MDITAKIVKLGELAVVAAGHPVRGAVDELPEGDVAMVQMRDVGSDGRIEWDGVVRIDPPGKRLPDFLGVGDLIFTTRGARNVAAVIEHVPGAAICAPNLFIIRVAAEVACLPDYLAWYVNQRPAQAYFQRSATGTSIMNIRREVVEALGVPVPSLREQETIVGISQAARAEKRLLQQLIQNRDQQMEALAAALAGTAEVGL